MGGTTTMMDPWLERFAARETEAIRAVSRLVGRIAAYPRFGVPRAEREDLVQETLAQLWQAIEAPEFDRRRSFEAFVRTIASRRCIDWRRVRRFNVEIPADMTAGGHTPESAALARERAAVGVQLLAALGERCRELIRLHALENLTYAEIGERWGRSEGALRVQMSQCLATARLRFRQLHEAEGTRWTTTTPC
ncbi:MAG TPA: sigma-70 family RNA polymerase sigma factor [Candidatus Polarisedimenticolaceae bacterium]|nr:sigma-70 family RNA polymerase sigma factor [Candidatus Polarisedimenticolaceae bacterium]